MGMILNILLCVCSIAGLQESLQNIVDEYPGEIGVACIVESRDTITVNNTPKYPMMSVFKLHQGIADCRYLEKQGISLDSMVSIPRGELNPDTWSPMLKEISGDTLTLSLGRLLRYSIEESDNNASNYLFATLMGPQETDDYISGLIPRESFEIRYDEEAMLADHNLAYANRTSPLGAAMLIDRLYTDPALRDLEFVRECLDRCLTGEDRIVAPLRRNPEIKAGHKTGSGFRDGGILAAHNDLAFIRLPDGSHYSLAIFVKDFPGTEAEASAAISRLSAAVLTALLCDKILERAEVLL